MSKESPRGIPKVLGTASGLFAGAMVGMSAGHIIGQHVTPHLPQGLDQHADLVHRSLAGIGGFGCAYAGSLLGAGNPEKALLVAAGSIVSQDRFPHIFPGHEQATVYSNVPEMAAATNGHLDTTGHHEHNSSLADTGASHQEHGGNLHSFNDSSAVDDGFAGIVGGDFDIT